MSTEPASKLEKRWPFPQRRGGFVATLLAALALLALAALVDRPVSAWAQDLPDGLRAFFRTVTGFGLSDWILVPSLILTAVFAIFARLPLGALRKLAFRQLTGVAGFVFLGVGLPGLVANLIKRAIGRGRPEMFDQVGAFDFQVFAGSARFESFPSGHATTAMAFCMVVAFLAPRSLRDMAFLSLLVVVSRVVVGAHYPTDVVAGAILGTLGAYTVRNLFATRGWVFETAGRDRVRFRGFAPLRRIFRRPRAD